jgi:hypothetical protein
VGGGENQGLKSIGIMGAEAKILFRPWAKFGNLSRMLPVGTAIIKYFCMAEFLNVFGTLSFLFILNAS